MLQQVQFWVLLVYSRVNKWSSLSRALIYPFSKCLEFSNSEVGDSFEIIRVCRGKRNLAQSCVLYEVTPNINKSHTCEPLGILKLRSRRQLWNYEGLYGEEKLAQSCVLYEVCFVNNFIHLHVNLIQSCHSEDVFCGLASGWCSKQLKQLHCKCRGNDHDLWPQIWTCVGHKYRKSGESWLLSFILLSTVCSDDQVVSWTLLASFYATLA